MHVHPFILVIIASQALMSNTGSHIWPDQTLMLYICPYQIDQGSHRGTVHLDYRYQVRSVGSLTTTRYLLLVYRHALKFGIQYDDSVDVLISTYIMSFSSASQVCLFSFSSSMIRDLGPPFSRVQGHTGPSIQTLLVFLISQPSVQIRNEGGAKLRGLSSSGDRPAQ